MTTDEKLRALKIMTLTTLADYMVFMAVWTLGIVVFVWVFRVTNPGWLMAAGFVVGLIARDLGKCAKHKLTPNAD